MPRLERRKELVEMAPMVEIYHEISHSIASSHEGKAHLSILTTPRLLPHVRLAGCRLDPAKPPSPPRKWVTGVLLFVYGPVRRDIW